MKSTSSQPDQEIIEILESLRSLKAEYPQELLSARRADFIKQITLRRDVGVKEAETSQDQNIIEILENLKAAKVEYPPELLAARRAAFMKQIPQRRDVGVKEAETSQDQNIIEILENLKAAKVEYPAELLAARRATFLAQVANQRRVGVGEEETVQDREVMELLASLKAAKVEYPPNLLAARRVSFAGQIRRGGSVSLLEMLRTSIQNGLSVITRIPLAPMMKAMRTSIVVAGVLAAAFLASLLGNRTGIQLALNPSPTQIEVSGAGPILPTNTEELETTICKPGYVPPLCLAKKFDTREDLTYQGNGARPAVAKDTLPGHSGIHQPAYINDGHYGNGSSWISNSPYSWIKIDLGEAKSINTVTFGRDRLGNYNDRNPGQFTIAVALSDDMYADGNSTNDNIEYMVVYDSQRAGFTGTVSSSQTVQAQFGSVTARYVKITFANPGTAIDEVEVFMVQPAFAQSDDATKRPNNRPDRPTATPIPTNTLRPTNTPTDVPTNTPLPTNTPTDVPTDTPVPTNTPPPTNTPTDVPTNTPLPTNTPTDVPTNTPRPTSTPLPAPTETLRPTSVPSSVPTDAPMSEPVS